MSRNTSLVLIAIAVLGCRTSMNKRNDASPGPEAGLADVALDSRLASDQLASDAMALDRMASDAPGLDLFSADTLTTGGVPKAFRIENHASYNIYIPAGSPVGCRVNGSAGWQDCTYFHDCTRLCPQVQEGQSCCVECEQQLGVYVIAPGQSRSIPWDGTIFMRQTGLCSDCQCDQPIPVTSGDFEATARIYIDYTCGPAFCTIPPDGFLKSATTTGPYLSFKIPFSVPFAGEEVVFTLTDNPPSDGGSLDAQVSHDSRPATDTPVASTLADVAGRQFTIAADEALPDASLYGRSCGTSNPGAHYRLIFSDDGTKVTVVRTDPVQETNLNGTLRSLSSTTLEYELTPTFAGASLGVRREGNDLIGNLSIHGSGVPVIWCIESPMRPV